MKIKKILIANRGEIAARIMRTCQEMFIKTVAVYSDADQDLPFVALADEAVNIGGLQASESYLDQDKIIEAVQLTGADAIHPGYGFLAENASFAQRCSEEGVIFIGPSAEAIEVMGSKIRAKQIMQEHGVPVIPGYDGDDQSLVRLIAEANKIPFPILIKASAGGGGKGMRVVRDSSQLEEAIIGAKREALASFGDDTVLIEKYFDSVRHIEFQIFGDNHGNAIHLFERECSIQRRHQKIIEETPSPFMDDELRNRMGEASVKAAKAIQYSGAGTVEFIVDEDKNFYFLEVNTRLQVEHPVTEAITGLDLVELQIDVAQGNELPFDHNELGTEGHAIQCRIYAEDPNNNFLPSTGKLQLWQTPQISDLRIDAALETGNEVGIFYDPMIAKVIVHGFDRAEAIDKMEYALNQLVALGLTTNQTFLHHIIQEPDFIAGQFDTQYIDQHPQLITGTTPTEQVIHEAAIATLLMRWQARQEKRNVLRLVPSGWRNNFYQFQFEQYVINGADAIKVAYQALDNQFFTIKIEEKTYTVQLKTVTANKVSFVCNKKRQTFVVAIADKLVYVKNGAYNLTIQVQDRLPEPEKEVIKGAYISPMPGEIIKVLVEMGQAVKTGDALLVINSMKMENTIYANEDGTVEEVFVSEKAFIEADSLLVKIA